MTGAAVPGLVDLGDGELVPQDPSDERAASLLGPEWSISPHDVVVTQVAVPS